MNKKAIVICLPNAFKFGWLGSTNRLFSIARAFQSLGFEIILIAQDYEDIEIQKTIESDFPGIIFRCGNYPFYLGKYNFFRKIVRVFWRLVGLEYTLYQLSLGWSDRFDVKSFYKKNSLSAYDVKLIWGMSGGMLGGANLANKFSNSLQVPWVMELHDPPIGADIKFEFSNIKLEFTRLLNDANLIVPTSDTYYKLLTEKYSINKEKFFPMRLTYKKHDINTATESKIDNFWRLGYAGSLNGGRTLSCFVEGLAAAIKLEPDIKLRLKITLAGTGEGFDEVFALAKQHQLEDLFEYKGLISSSQANSLMNDCHGMLIVQPTVSNLEIPGKVFQMLSFMKPIIALMDPDSETAAILFKSKVGFVAEITDVEELKFIILKLFKQHVNQVSIKPDIEFIESFSETRLPANLLKIFSKLSIEP
jgi:hypothetical protein